MKRFAIFVLATQLAVPAAGLRASQEQTKSVQELIQDLKSSDTNRRRDAAYALDRLGPAAREAAPALIEALNDGDEQVWFHAVQAVAKLGPHARAAVPKLLKDLEGGGRRGGQRVYRSAHALGCIGEAALPSLVRALGSSSSGARGGAALALGFVATVPPEGI